MRKLHRAYGFNTKDVSDDRGTFSGYGSVFDVIDSYREVVAPGAFAESLKRWEEKGRLPPILYQHRSGEPLGPFTLMREDERGLYVEGELLVDDIQRAREVRALLKRKAIAGLSIGFNVVGEAYDSRSGVYTIKEADLWEVSIVTFPANEAANVESVKAMRLAERVRGGELPTLREFEEWLRDEGGYSQSQAKAIAGRGLSYLHREGADKAATPAGLLTAVRVGLGAALSNPLESPRE